MYLPSDAALRPAWKCAVLALVLEYYRGDVLWRAVPGLVARVEVTKEFLELISAVAMNFLFLFQLLGSRLRFATVAERRRLENFTVTS